MIIRSLLKRVELNKVLVGIARFFLIGPSAKRFYFKLHAPKNKIIELIFNRICAQSYVNNFEQLRYTETIFEEDDKYEGKVLAALLEILQPGDIAYDIGAYIGIHTVFMAKKVGDNGRIVAFEPATNNYEALNKNIILNDLNNVIAVKVALGDQISNGSLYVKKRIGSGATSLVRNEESSFCQEVEIVPGDSIIESKKLPLPKAVKIDVEGYEYPVIKGLQKTLSEEICKLVCCEIHSVLFPIHTNPQMILDLLRSMGFVRIETHERGGEIHAICFRA